jgi:ABC-type dipeptide/oligopeptide/nickel transport system permease component
MHCRRPSPDRAIVATSGHHGCETMFGIPARHVTVRRGHVQDVDIEAGAVFMTFVATSTQLLADLSYIYLNPRIRYK